MRADLRDVLVAIPALNEEAHIGRCLASLADAGARGATLVVADGGSTDGTKAEVVRMAREIAGLRLLENPARLQSAGINAVAAEAESHHRVLLRCDAHAVYPPGFVARVAEGLDARGTAALAVPMDAVGQTAFQRAAAWGVDTPLGSGGAAHRGGRRSGLVDHGHHAGMLLDWFRRVGGYDPAFSHNEDAEFDVRLAAAGGRIWLDAEIRLDYVMRATPSALARQYWNYGKGRARTVLKHRLRPRLRQILPVVNLVGFGAGLMLAPVLPLALLWPLGYGLVLAGASVAAVIALQSVAGIWAGAALFLMHMAWGAGFLRGMIGGRVDD